MTGNDGSQTATPAAPVIQQAATTPTNDGTVAATPEAIAPEEVVKLFTPEEVKAKKEAVEKAKAEEDRRNKLTPEEKAAEDKAKEEAQKDEEAKKKDGEVPEKYELKFPEGVEPDTRLLAEFEPFAKETGLSQKQAQNAIDFYVSKILPGFIADQQEAFQAQMTEWETATKNDTEIGGDKFEASKAAALRVVSTFGSDDLKEAFNSLGIGNHPEFVRVFARIAEKLRPDTLEGMGSKGTVSTGSKLWPSLKEG